MNTREFTVDVSLYDNGRIGASSTDIRGLVLECDSWSEMRDELLRVGPELLKSNHGLTDEDIASVTFVVTLGVWEDNPQQPASKYAASGATLVFSSHDNHAHL